MTTVVVALDVGGTGIKCALVRYPGSPDHDEAGQPEVAHVERHPTGTDRGPEAVLETILDIAEGLAGKARANGLVPTAVGVAVPGVVDEAAGVAVWSANIGFRNVPLRDLIHARLGLPTAVGHDVRAGATAEARLGAGRGARHVLFAAIGTGIAAAPVIEGQVFTGAHGAAGEVGHLVVRPGGPRCGCGQSGCLEAVASAAAVGRRYGELAGTPATAAQVATAVAAGEPTAMTVWQETVEALADGLLAAQTLFDPEIIVLGGGLAEAGDILLDPLRAALHARLTFHREPRLVRAALGDEAGCIGAGLLALDTLTAGDGRPDDKREIP
ncbi:MAG TPA: ROK family protein [Micromonosporaceae bacterium]|nr:ROK family protein [Micromonosporaceae bacterium]